MEISRPVGRMFSFTEIRRTVASPEGAAQLGTSLVNLLLKRSHVPVAGIVEWLLNLCHADHKDSRPYIFQRDLHVSLLGTFLTVFSNGNRGDIFVNGCFTSSRHCPELEWTSKNGPGNSFKHMAALQTQMRSGYLAACIYFICKNSLLGRFSCIHFVFSCFSHVLFLQLSLRVGWVELRQGLVLQPGWPGNHYGI